MEVRSAPPPRAAYIRHMVAHCAAGSAGDFLLVDRSKSRMIRALAAAVDEECVVVSNHLCGGGLDAALRCALDAWGGGDDDGAADAEREDGAVRRVGRLAGIAAVTCCHHSCTDATFLGSAFLHEDCGLGPADVALVRKWSLTDGAAALEGGDESQPRRRDGAAARHQRGRGRGPRAELPAAARQRAGSPPRARRLSRRARAPRAI